MIKKLILGIAALCVTTPLYAKPEYRGTLVSGVRSYQSGGALYTTNFSCDGDDLGSFDVCLETYIQVPAKTPFIWMNAKISPETSKHYKTILQRYILSAARDENAVAIYLRSPETHHTQLILLTPDREFRAYRLSKDGGKTWSQIQFETQ